MKKPPMRPLTIKQYQYQDNVLEIETLTAEAKGFINEHAAEFGRLQDEWGKGKTHCMLFVHAGYQVKDVIDYLIGLWDEQEWPAEIDAERKGQE